MMFLLGWFNSRDNNVVVFIYNKKDACVVKFFIDLFLIQQWIN